MNFSKRILGYREFSPVEDISDMVVKDKGAGVLNEETKKLNIFQTSKQKTWLVSIDDRLYCVLDDVRTPKPQIKWDLPVADIKDSIKISTQSPTEKTGMIDIGINHKDWLFSKNLFTETSIDQEIRKIF